MKDWLRSIGGSIMVVLIIGGGILVIAALNDSKASGKSTDVLAKEMKFGIQTRGSLTEGPSADSTNFTVFTVERVEGVPGSDLHRVLARNERRFLVSGLAGEEGITNGDRVTFRMLVNQTSAANSFEQRIFVAKKVR